MLEMKFEVVDNCCIGGMALVDHSFIRGVSRKCRMQLSRSDAPLRELLFLMIRMRK